ncbi:hypothetical protein ACS0TY_007158 [Phlomoides rotata]
MNRFQPFQIGALELAYEEYAHHLTRERKIELASQTGLDVEQITCWFNRKRARERNRETRRALERRIAELQRELQDRRRVEIELRDEIQRLRQLLGRTAESNIDPIIRFVNGY